jgi:hypothetical protein
MPTGAANFGAGRWPGNSAVTTWSDRWGVGAAGDNAAMESFWSLLPTNVLNQQR